MGLAILFKRSPKSSPFRNACLDLIRYRPKGPSKESLLVGTGYLNADIIHGPTDTDSPPKDELIKAVCDGYRDDEKIVFVAGGYDDNKHTLGAYICVNNATTGSSKRSAWLAPNNRGTCNSCEFDFFTTYLNHMIKSAGRKIVVDGFKCQLTTN